MHRQFFFDQFDRLPVRRPRFIARVLRPTARIPVVASEGVTDKKGILKLKDLKAMSYFVIVRKDDKDNSGGGERTGKLEAKKINKVTIVIQ